MKKTLIILAVLAVSASLLVGCSGNGYVYYDYGQNQEWSANNQSANNQQQDVGVGADDFIDTIRPVVNSFEGIMDRLIALLDDLDAVDTMDDLAAWGNRLTEINQQTIVIIEGLEGFAQFAPQELIGSFNQLIAAADSIHLAMNQLDDGVEAGILGDDDEFFRLVDAFETDFNAASAQWSAALAAM